MTTVSKNIKFLRKKERLTQEQLAERIGIKRSLLGAYEEGRADPRLNNLLAISRIFNVSVDQLISADISQNQNTSSTSTETLASGTPNLKILSITVDSQNKENIELVPYKASAGYLNGYADPEYLEDLPRFQLPTLPSSGTYRAFEINGDSMLPLTSGTVVVGRYLEKLSDIKAGEPYILLTKKEGVVYKRIFYQNDERESLLLVSDNPNYSPYELEKVEVLEVWEAKSYISQSFPKPSINNHSSTENNITLEKLTSIVLNLQKEVINLQSSRNKEG